MKRNLGPFISLCLLTGAAAADPALTIYNQDFAVVRDAVPLDLKPGVNEVRFAGATAHLEPSSVVLRDPSGRHPLQILEQNFRADPISQELLLSLNEGKTIQFEVTDPAEGRTRRELVTGKIIRSGYVPHSAAMGRYGPAYAMTQSALADGGGTAQPIIEVDGKLRFSLPGRPLFPALGDDTILKPTLLWVLETDRAARFDAELSYVTGGMRWNADYNLVLPERGDTLDLIGWVTLDNQSGKSFPHARIKLMAGDVNKIQNAADPYSRRYGIGGFGGGVAAPPVSEKAFDEYHLYTLARPTTLLDRETKQVEFVSAPGVKSTAFYVYDGANISDWLPTGVRTDSEYGTQCNKKVALQREFTNSVANHLGLPLPKGRVRLYRRNTDGQMEFIGENEMDHTPRDEVVRLATGNAFDLVGERKRTEFRLNLSGNGTIVDPNTGLPVASGPTTNALPGQWIDEGFEITVRNHKTEPVAVRVVEHLYRWSNWQITKKSHSCQKTDAQTVEFPIQIPPDAQQTVRYTVHYSW